MLHRSGPSVWRLGFLLVNSCLWLCPVAVRGVRDKRAADAIEEHRLAIKLHLVGFQFLDNFVNSLTEVPGFKMCPCFGTLVLLASIIISVYSLVISQIDVFILALRLWLLLELILIVWQLVKVIFILMTALVAHCFDLFGMNSSLIYHFVLFE